MNGPLFSIVGLFKEYISIYVVTLISLIAEEVGINVEGVQKWRLE